MIELRNVTKQYGQSSVLNKIDLTVDEPGIYCLLGRNGAGKTTTIRMILGIIKKDSGKSHGMERMWIENP